MLKQPDMVFDEELEKVLDIAGGSCPHDVLERMTVTHRYGVYTLEAPRMREAEHGLSIPGLSLAPYHLILHIHSLSRINFHNITYSLK